MKTLVYAGPRKAELREKEIPNPGKGQVRIRVSYCGVCGSDIGIFSGNHPRAKAPLVLGHEFIGKIEAIHDKDSRYRIGDRVCIYPLISCGHCFACRTGIPHVCQTLKLIGIDVDGGIAEYVCCDESVLFKIDDSVPDRAAAVTEPLAVIIRTLHQSRFKMGDTAVIIGAGPIGALTGIVLRRAGAARIVISDVDEKRLNLCKELGFETVNVRKTDLVDYVNRVTDNTGMDVVFECSGSEEAALESTRLCRIGGRICITATHKFPHAVNLQDVNFKELTLIGSRVYTKREFGQAVEFIREIVPELEKIVTQVIPLAESDKVFEKIGNPSEMTMKVLIDCR